MPPRVAQSTQLHDAEALYWLFRSAMERHVNAARGGPWNEERERTQFLTQLAPACVQVILLEGKVVGFVDLRVLKANPGARRFYERAGFRETGSSERHHQMAWECH